MEVAYRAVQTPFCSEPVRSSAACGRGFFYMSKWILETGNLRLSYGDRQLLDTDRLTVYDGERIGLIGENGAGKTTLLRILAGEIFPDEGTVRCLVPLAMIRQQGGAGTARDAEIKALFRARDTRKSLSGGELTRNRIAEALSAHPRLLLADEPTTDLDEEGLKLLRKQLSAFTGAIILISHDRSLLRALCGRIWYLEDGKITDFSGGYDAFMAERIRRRERAAFEYDQYRAEQKRLKESAQRMAERASQVKKAPSRMGNGEARLHKREWTDSVLQLSHAKRTLQNRMEHLEAREKPRALPEIRMKLGVSHPVGAKTVLEFSCRSLSAGGQVLLEDASFFLPTGSRTALIGPNGCGKTTLLRLLNGRQDPGICLDGTFRFNPAVRPGWFDQHHESTLDPGKTVLENVLAPSVHPESFARTVLACLGIAGDAVHQPVRLLSGGEKAKVSLGRLMLMDCNTLFLDEPTNHLDLFTMEELERLLACYGGTLFFVSHDEEFIRKTATRVIRFEHGRLHTLESPPETPAAVRKTVQPEKDRDLAVTTLEMRLAALFARMAAPKKGDRPDQLQAEYLQLAEELRSLKTK